MLDNKTPLHAVATSLKLYTRDEIDSWINSIKTHIKQLPDVRIKSIIYSDVDVQPISLEKAYIIVNASNLPFDSLISRMAKLGL